MVDYFQTHTALTEYVLERDGCPIHYWVGGQENRPLVVLMHGATMDHRMFNAQIEALIPEYRLLVWDARGHGKSQPRGKDFSLETCAADMLTILDKTGVEKAVIGGQSLGGYIAQHIYIMAPHRMTAAIIIGSTPLAKAYSKFDIWALKATMPLFGIWPYRHLTKTIARNTAFTEPVRHYALKASRQIGHQDFLKIWKAVTLAVDEKGRAGFTIDVPLLLMHGQFDRTGSIRRDMPHWSKAEPCAHYHLIPEAGHNANQDNPTFTNERLLDFLHQYAL